MMKRTLIVIVTFYASVGLSQTIEKNENSIDSVESNCLEKKDISNAEICNCIRQARESWDIELNKYYALLRTNLPKEAFEILNESQKRWINYRDKEFQFISTFYHNVQEGTMWYSVAENKKKEIVKQRAVELEEHFKSLDF